MVCPKCGAMVNDDVSVCDNCGYEFETATAAAETDGSEYISNAPALPDAFKKQHRRRISFKEFTAYACVLIIAAMIVIFAFYGASFIGAAGKSLNAIQTSGTSIFGFSAGLDRAFSPSYTVNRQKELLLQTFCTYLFQPPFGTPLHALRGIVKGENPLCSAVRQRGDLS
mgnify:CR=1 FL=1